MTTQSASYGIAMLRFLSSCLAFNAFSRSRAKYDVFNKWFVAFKLPNSDGHKEFFIARNIDMQAEIALCDQT